jgi:BMFP domain-containing protein YqiC
VLEKIMPFDTKILDDLMRVAGGAFETVAGVRDEARARMRDRFERVLAEMDMVTREEFEVVRAMIAEARTVEESLAARVAALEAATVTAAAKTASRAKIPSTRPVRGKKTMAGPRATE